MALVVFDRVKESSNTVNTGTLVLDGAQTGYQSFAVVGNGNQTYYTIAAQSSVLLNRSRKWLLLSLIG